MRFLAHATAGFGLALEFGMVIARSFSLTAVVNVFGTAHGANHTTRCVKVCHDTYREQVRSWKTACRTRCYRMLSASAGVAIRWLPDQQIAITMDATSLGIVFSTSTDPTPPKADRNANGLFGYGTFSSRLCGR